MLLSLPSSQHFHWKWQISELRSHVHLAILCLMIIILIFRGLGPAIFLPEMLPNPKFNYKLQVKYANLTY